MMTSPVHSFLFSPPTSPPAQIDTPSTQINPLSSLEDFLLPIAPSPSQRYTHHPKVSSPLATVQTISNAQAGPGGFNSTSAYPSRYSTGMRRPSAAERRASPPPPLPAFNASDAKQVTESYEKLIEKTESQRRRSSAYGTPMSVSPSTSFVRTIKSSLTRRRGYRYGLLALGLIIGLCLFFKKHDRAAAYHKALYQPSGALSPAEIRERLVEMAEEQAFFGAGSRVAGGNKLHARPLAGEEDDAAENEGGVGPAPPIRTTRTAEIQHISPERELLALQAYLLESESNEVIASLDPNVPLDPTMMVSFDPKDERGWNELKRETDPVVVWDVGFAETKTTHEILDHYAILPAPRTFRLKDRADARQIQSIFSRLVPGRAIDLNQPLITIGGVPVDGYEALAKHHEDGTLAEMLTEAGAVVVDRKKLNGCNRRGSGKVGRLDWARSRGWLGHKVGERLNFPSVG